MKKIFFFALASLALASCSQDEEFAPEKSTNGSNRANGALSFSTYTAGATRATDVTSADVKTNGFQVAAWYDGGLYFEAGETAKVNDGVTNGIADTQTDTYYWPSFSAGEIGFRAFNLSSDADWNDEYNSVKFTVAGAADDQKDLVIAYAEATEKPTDGVQPLNFTHALSKVNFSFKGATADKYTINKVEVIAAGQDDAVMEFLAVTDLAADGVDTNQPADGKQENKVKWTFTPIDGTQPLVKKNAAAAANQGVLYTYYDETDGVEASAMEDKNFMLLPQTGKIAVRVYYKVEDANGKLLGNCGYELTDSKGRHESNSNFDNSDNKAIYGCKTVVINLGTDKDDSVDADNNPTPADIPAWEAGKAYRFTMTLPKDNFIGDKSNDGVADGLDDNGTAETTDDVDLDGDNDKDPSEFDILTPIRFSVTVSKWVDVAANNITIK
ncbi:MAG: fimbrillin family protein [Bacteroidales bacterium]|nr:fimbrillin family protein [Candidatus Scybalocola fimicaballi]